MHTDDNNVDFNSVLLFTYDSIFLLTATEYITKIAMLLGWVFIPINSWNFLYTQKQYLKMLAADQVALLDLHAVTDHKVLLDTLASALV